MGAARLTPQDLDSLASGQAGFVLSGWIFLDVVQLFVHGQGGKDDRLRQGVSAICPFCNARELIGEMDID